MKKFLVFVGLGFGGVIGAWLAYSFTYSESVRLVVAVLGGVIGTAVVILLTAWIVAGTMARAYGNQRHTYQNRYDQRPQFPGGQLPLSLPPGSDFYQGQNYMTVGNPGYVEGGQAGDQEEIVA